MDQVAVEVALPGRIEPDVLAVPVAEDGAAAFSNGARVVDERLNGRLRALVDSGEASGEVGRTLVVHTDGELRARRVATTGVGPIEEVDADTLRTAAAAVVRAAPNVGGTIGWLVDEQLPLSAEEQARAVVEGIAGGGGGGPVGGFSPPPRRYRRYVDSAFADMMNSSDLKQAAPALAAEFLHEFAGDGPWAHIDMAGPAFLERSRGDYLTQRGGTGYGVRLIVELAQSLST